MGLKYMLNVYLKPWFLAHEKQAISDRMNRSHI